MKSKFEWNELTENVLHQNLDFSLDAGDVRAIIGVDAGSFQQWLARDLLQFEMVRMGKRRFRKFHITQVPKLVLIAEIWKNGVSIGEAISVADEILAHVNKHPFSGRAQSSATLRAKKMAREHAPLLLILWFRQGSRIDFYSKGDPRLLSAIFAEEGYSSCIVIHVDTLRGRIREAVLAAKREREARGEQTFLAGGVQKNS